MDFELNMLNVEVFSLSPGRIKYCEPFPEGLIVSEGHRRVAYNE